MFWRWLVRILKCLWMIKVKNSMSCKTFTKWNRRKTKKLLQMKSKRQQKMYLFQRLRTYSLCRLRYRVFVEKNTQTKLLQVVQQLVSNLFNNNVFPWFSQIWKRWQKQTTLDSFFDGTGLLTLKIVLLWKDRKRKRQQI